MRLLSAKVVLSLNVRVSTSTPAIAAFQRGGGSGSMEFDEHRAVGSEVDDDIGRTAAASLNHAKTSAPSPPLMMEEAGTSVSLPQPPIIATAAPDDTAALQLDVASVSSG